MDEPSRARPDRPAQPGDQEERRRRRPRPLLHPHHCHRRCTFPGCSRPPDWTDAHHPIHWADGGHTDLDNAALLCRMHHGVVHSRHLAATVTTGPPGSTNND
uniref:HNH endonuclease signature motif containing protein n=1 Tax=Nostocoides australiense TaxID=99480 RepID=UPI002E10D7C0